MATSGTVTLSTKSVDYNGGGPYTRGNIILTNIIGWTVENGDISFSSISSSDNIGGHWGLCYVNLPYYLILKPQVSYNNGSSWVDLDTETKDITTVCVSGAHAPYTNAVASSIELINSLGTYHLTGNCLLRFLYATNSTPIPNADNPAAFPDTGYSAVTQVPVEVIVDYRPGAVLDGVWKSHDRSAGTAHIYDGTKWVEMKTSEGHSSSENPPSINDGTKWVNQNKIGQE